MRDRQIVPSISTSYVSKHIADILYCMRMKYSSNETCLCIATLIVFYSYVCCSKPAVLLVYVSHTPHETFQYKYGIVSSYEDS